jgi:hypothetical protein
MSGAVPAPGRRRSTSAARSSLPCRPAEAKARRDSYGTTADPSRRESADRWWRHSLSGAARASVPGALDGPGTARVCAKLVRVEPLVETCHGRGRGRRTPDRLRTRGKRTGARAPPRLCGRRTNDVAAAARRALRRVHSRSLGRARGRSLDRPPRTLRHRRIRRLPRRLPREVASRHRVCGRAVVRRHRRPCAPAAALRQVERPDPGVGIRRLGRFAAARGHRGAPSSGARVGRRRAGGVRRYITAVSNLLLEPLGPAARDVLLAGSCSRAIADAFFSGFDEPQRLWPWIEDQAEARRFAAATAGRSWRPLSTRARWALGLASRRLVQAMGRKEAP